MLGHPQNYVLLPMPCLGVYGFFMSCNYVTVCINEVQRNMTKFGICLSPPSSIYYSHSIWGVMYFPL